MGGGGWVARVCVHFVFTVHRQYTRTPVLGYTDTLIAKPTQYDNRGMTLATGILANLPAG